MKFRNKIFLMMIMISLLTLVSLGAVSVIQFLHTKTEVRIMQNFVRRRQKE